MAHSKPTREGARPLPFRRAALRVLLPFASGYYLSYLFRTVGALVSGRLAAELHLSPASLGLLNSTYFLTFALAQLPLGVALDRHGPRRVQAVLLPLAALGAGLFACAHGLALLALARALIGLGSAAALMAGLKALALWFPAERLALANGVLVMLGALGAVTATAPAEALLRTADWRALFALLALVTAASAALIAAAVPRRGDAAAGHGRVTGEAAGRVPGPPFLAPGAAFDGVHRHLLRHAGALGRALAGRRGGPAAPGRGR